ncbi:MAG: RNB domain-containing ribonuclease [Candidatus Cloacimonas sp.]|nr:RNB domain-containing ribonuclease [Candidatus Cloacimonas sp.]
MASSNLYTIAAFYQSRELQFGLITALELGQCTIVTESGALIELSQARLVYFGNVPIAVTDPVEILRQFRQALQVEAVRFVTVDFSFLEYTELTLLQIAEKLQLENDLEHLALYIYLKDHKELFSAKKDAFRLKSGEEQLAFRAETKAFQAREEYLEDVRKFLSGAQLSVSSEDKLFSELPFIGCEKSQRDLYKLILNAYPQLKPEEAVKAFRIRCGELPAVVDPAIAESGIPIGWSRQLVNENLLPCVHLETAGSAFCIDDEDTRDYDDALSLLRDGNLWKLGIHVSSVASRIEPGSRLFSEVSKRVSSFYAANYIAALLPPQFSEGELSLIAGTVRPVVSLYLWLDEEFTIIKQDIRSEQISISHNYSYREVDKHITEEPFSQLKKICQKMNERRESSHIQEKPRFYYYLKEKMGKLEMRKIDNYSPARIIVEEMMIRFNSSLAEFMRDKQIPVLYRNISQYYSSGEANPASQAYLSTSAEYHPGIGTAAYLHGTSPIRRYTDLLNQYQLIAALAGEKAPFSAEYMEEGIQHIEKRLNLLKEVAFLSERYWFLKYIEANLLHAPVDACLRAANNGKLRLEIMPWGKQVLAICDSYPKTDSFKIVVYAVDLGEGVVKIDLL